MKKIFIIGFGTIMFFLGISTVFADYRRWDHDGYRHDRHRPHWHSGVYINVPLYPYGTYRPYRREVIREIERPVIYVEKQNEPISSSSDKLTSNDENYWYYCKKPAGYYPQVERCPDGWMKVVPHKPSE